MESMPGTAIIRPVIGHTLIITRVPTVSIDRITTGIIPLRIIALTEFIVGVAGKYLASLHGAPGPWREPRPALFAQWIRKFSSHESDFHAPNHCPMKQHQLGSDY